MIDGCNCDGFDLIVIAVIEDVDVVWL